MTPCMAKRTTTGPFRRPEEMRKERKLQPRSIRFTPETETILEEEAAKAKMEFSTLVRQICDDYVKWLREQR